MERKKIKSDERQKERSKVARMEGTTNEGKEQKKKEGKKE